MCIVKITGSVTATAKGPQLTASKMLIEDTTNANGKAVEAGIVGRDATGHNRLRFVTATSQK